MLALVTALGLLSATNVPKIRGRDSFAGEQYHTGNWPANVSFEGKRVGVIGTGHLQGRGMGGMTAYGAQIEAVLQQREPLGIEIDHGNVVVFGHQAGGEVGADLAGAENDDLHRASSRRRPWRIFNCLSLR
jgi:hypothetical protein